MRLRAASIALMALVLAGCATTAPKTAAPSEPMHGMASWYGEEFAGRTTANGEIFDPMQLTAAHRSLPFGTVVDVTNAKTNQTVRVRINDRGPYVGNRIVDLSYAAAQQISLIEPGTGEVDLKIVAVGKGDLEPPAPLVVKIDPTKDKALNPAADPPQVAFPLPQTAGTAATPDSNFGVQVVEEHGGTPTRRQVGADGKTIQDVPIDGGGQAPAPVQKAPPKPSPAPAKTPVVAPAKKTTQYVVQVGAFAVEANAKALQERLMTIGQKAHVDRDSLYLVRIGPFNTRDEAVKVRSALESSGLSALIVVE